jgi:aspartate/methionine/tyrosine aminotransferase
MDEARDTVVAFVKKFYPLPTHSGELSREHVLLTTGVTAAAYSILTLSIHEKEDVVLSPLPVYAVYEHQTAILGGTFDGIVTQQERRWKPTIEDMEKAFQKHTKKESKAEDRAEEEEEGGQGESKSSDAFSADPT